MGTPSSSNGEAAGPIVIVPSSTSVNSSEPTCCPTIDANNERCFRTASADSAPASTPRNDIAANWSSTIGTFAVGGFVAPNIRTARRTASSAMASQPRSSMPRPIVNENPVCVSSPSTASDTATHQASVRAYSACTPVVDAIATRDTASPIWAASIFDARGSIEIGAPLQVQRQRDLPVGGDVRLVLAVQLRDRCCRRRSRQHVELVGLGERRVLPRAPDRLAHLVGRRVGCVRVAEPAAGDQADPDAARLRERQPLDLTAERARLRVTRLLGVRLHGFVARRRLDRGRAELVEVRHPCPRP